MKKKDYGTGEYARFQLLKDKIEHLEFKQQLLFNNSNIDRLLFEYDIEKEDYTQIMNIMDKFREQIEEKNERISHVEFENEILNLIGRENIDYHFCEYIAKAFMEDGRWEEVFPALYGHMPKYQQYLNEMKDGE
jgi:hypothetical protein